MTLLGLALGVLVSAWFLALPVFVGVNLLQSSFTDICPAEKLLPGCESSEPSTGSTA
jgi:hypothetical protein